MPTSVNGRALGVAQNGQFTTANTDPIPGGRLWPEAALTWNSMRAAYVAAGGNPGDFMPAGPRSSARSLRDQEHFWRTQPPPAARPGTSNHGWGIAVDVLTRRAAAWIMANGPRYGWSWDEGKRVGEWWHFRYVGASRAQLRRLTRDPLAGYTASERRWIGEYDRLRRANRDLARRRVLRRVMAEQAQRIERAAKSDRAGWTRTRKRRHASLTARSK